MKRLSILAAMGAALTTTSARADLIYDFEGGVEGLHGFGATVITPDTIGATHGTGSAAIAFAGFDWLESPVSLAIAAACKGQDTIYLDATLTGTLGGWANSLVSYNDVSGWRQTGGANLITNPGTGTTAIDVSGLSAPDISQNWFKLCFSVNSEIAGTIYVDNVRTPIWHATAYNITQGFEIGGTIDSLRDSDADALAIFPDETSLMAVIEVSSMTTDLNPVSLKLSVETSVARYGLSQSLEAYNFTTEDWDDVDGRVAPTSNEAIDFIPATPGDYVGSAGELICRLTWGPINDEDPSQDGWAHYIERTAWDVRPL